MSRYSTTEPGVRREPARLVYAWRWTAAGREGLLLTPCDTTALMLLTRAGGYPGRYGRRWIRAHDFRTLRAGSAPAPLR